MNYLTLFNISVKNQVLSVKNFAHLIRVMPVFYIGFFRMNNIKKFNCI